VLAQIAKIERMSGAIDLAPMRMDPRGAGPRSAHMSVAVHCVRE
jgi:hypothetical protein